MNADRINLTPAEIDVLRAVAESKHHWATRLEVISATHHDVTTVDSALAVLRRRDYIVRHFARGRRESYAPTPVGRQELERAAQLRMV